jgi:Leucine-rich repeat (LRR) protein
MARDEAYRKAEEKIEEARRSGAKELNLNGKWDEASSKLTEVPESLGQLRQLQSLDLSTNQLTALPQSLGQLTQLQSLKLNNNQLAALPESLSQFTQLQTLSAGDNQLTELPESLGYLTKLESFDIFTNQLSILPKSFVRLSRLRSLNLAANKFSIFPNEIFSLRVLENLRMRTNQLSSLPPGFDALKQLVNLNLSENQFRNIPDPIRSLTSLEELYLFKCLLDKIPDWIYELKQLKILEISHNSIEKLPATIGQMRFLEDLRLGYRAVGTGNPLSELPACIRELKQIKHIHVFKCNLNDLPLWINELHYIETLDLNNNPLNPELAAANTEGILAVKRYLRSKIYSQIVLNEAKLILIGEGEVGKSCLLGALRGDDWVEKRDSTHGIEIKPVKVTVPHKGTEITLNGWDFGGQRVYRPTHQLFFSAPAVYLVVWKPREGSQAGAVKEWIKLVKHREPDAKILVVATHGGPKERQPDIDRQEIWDQFGKDTVVDFFHVDSQPPEKNEKTSERTGECPGIKALKDAIARVAANLPEVGRSVPKSWQDAREALKATQSPYLPLKHVLEICSKHTMDEDTARLFVTVSHRLGHLVHYGHDPALRDIVILKPDWLATAISFVLDDKKTREKHGLVNRARLGQLWNDPEREKAFRYDPECHPIFLRLMERYDLSYRVADAPDNKPDKETSLIAQLVPDVRPQADLEREWPPSPSSGDTQQVQICQVVDQRGHTATAEGLLYQLIVRMHRFSLGRADNSKSIHWQRGLALEDDIGSRALLEHIGNDIRITVRSPYPERFLSALTYDVKWLVETFWTGLRCPVMVPCLNPQSCAGLFEVSKLIENLKRKRPEQPCPICNEWQNIEDLLHNAPAARPNPLEELVLTSLIEVQAALKSITEKLRAGHGEVIGRFDQLDASSKELVSKVEAAYTNLIQTLLDEAKDGPRLFSFEPLEPGFWDRPRWISTKYRVTLWCEHSRQPLHAIYGKDDTHGMYDVTVPRQWLTTAAPFLKVLTGTLSLVLPVAASATKLLLDDATFKGIEKQMDLGQKSFEAVIKGGEKAGPWLSERDAPNLEPGGQIQARGSVLRQLHAWLKEKDPSYGGLVRVMNKRQEFLWVHPQFEKEY